MTPQILIKICISLQLGNYSIYLHELGRTLTLPFAVSPGLQHELGRTLTLLFAVSPGLQQIQLSNIGSSQAYLALYRWYHQVLTTIRQG